MITVNSGLYHKLHGVPRPGTMKKTIIKRRKRVVAPPNESFDSTKQTSALSTTADSIPTPNTATGDTVLPNDESTLHQLLQRISDAVSMSEERANMVDGDSTSGTVSQQSVAGNTALSNYNPRTFPPPIDFTSSFRSQSSPASVASSAAPTVSVSGSPTYNSHEDKTLAPLQLNQHHPNSSGLNQPPPRKRSISVSSGGDNNEDGPANPQRLNSISSILNPRSSSSNTDIPIEPSLLGFTASGIDEEHQRIYHLREKRLRLMCEQKRLREEMEALDKELETAIPLEGASGAVIQDTGMNLTPALTAGRNGDREGDNTGINGTSGQNHRIL